MRLTFFTVLFILTLTASGQTDSIEKKLLLKKLNDKILTQEDFARIFQKWKQTLKVAGAYPDLPLDQNGEVHYSFVKTFDGEGNKLFNRTMEWLAIYYGIRPADIYSNKEDGKIIFQNSVSLSSSKTCTFTSVITVKGSKIRVEYVNLGYQIWVPEQTNYIHISQLYPVVEKVQAEWPNTLNLFKITNQTFNSDFGKLSIYLENYESITMF